MLQQGLRFLAVGTFNFVVTYGLYCLLVIWWHPQLAWFTVVVLGLFLGFYLHGRLVFGATLAPHNMLRYGLVQLLLYLVSSGIIHVGMRYGGLGPRVAAALAIVANVPLSFLITRMALRDRV